MPLRGSARPALSAPRRAGGRPELSVLLLCPKQPASPPPPQQFVVPHSLFGSPVPKAKDPPRYEEAIKQTRSAQSSLPEVSRPRAPWCWAPSPPSPGLDPEAQVSSRGASFAFEVLFKIKILMLQTPDGFQHQYSLQFLLVRISLLVLNFFGGGGPVRS